jgi:hypothetical protein
MLTVPALVLTCVPETFTLSYSTYSRTSRYQIRDNTSQSQRGRCVLEPIVCRQLYSIDAYGSALSYTLSYQSITSPV